MSKKRILYLKPFNVEITLPENINIDNYIENIKNLINKKILINKLSGKINIMIGLKDISINWKFI